jgi:hypothetical protein
MGHLHQLYIYYNTVCHQQAKYIHLFSILIPTIRFIAKLLVFCSVLIASYLFLVNKLSQGYVDMYYPKFTQRGGNLILGLSRADQGIVPAILQEELKSENYAETYVNFASNQSFYGEVYLNAVKEKLDQSVANGLFVLSVTPGCFTAPKSAGEKEIVRMDEYTIMGKADNFTSNPNYNYIVNCYGEPLYNALHNFTVWENLKSHQDGWNEVSMTSQQMKIEEKDIDIWKSQNLTFYNRKVRTETFKAHRENSFEETIRFLKKHGVVFLVRLPADPDIIALENENWANFDQQMERIARDHNISYLNYSMGFEGFRTYDGSHMPSESARMFTRLLATDIKKISPGNQISGRTQ